MSYKPLREILYDLDRQQREETAALCGRVNAAEMQRVRNAKKQLAMTAVFFIERSWEVLAPQIEAFSLEEERGKSPEELRAYLERLRNRQPAFAWGWIRARMNARLMRWLEVCIPDLLLQHPERAALYAESLRKVDWYWFRESPLHHLKTGYHTALAVACKWYGSAFELLPDAAHPCPHSSLLFREELRHFASFSLTMLTRADGYLWDSAGAEPLAAIVEEGTLKIAHKAIQELSLDTAPDYGLRLGCPALRARSGTERPAFSGVIAWVEQVFCRHLGNAQAN